MISGRSGSFRTTEGAHRAGSGRLDGPCRWLIIPRVRLGGSGPGGIRTACDQGVHQAEAWVENETDDPFSQEYLARFAFLLRTYVQYVRTQSPFLSPTWYWSS